ncbi:hypothetical protein [Cellulomonas fimi]|uniref:Uncharacterized protein n=1 Tax=Cellulomonas fimi TaxID=1708 RepID=A0A7Y0QIX3_CELFI|nr:hypothetical protein [Cellulomonas fimi]NMR21678.1 hypothetical protein [Cellulomonas fimi]
MRVLTRITATLACAALATTLATPALAAPADAPPVEWVVSSHDSLGDAITTATATQDAAAVAAALEAMSTRAANGHKVDFPGLDTAPLAVVESITDAAADALKSGSDLPTDVTSFDLAPDSGAVVMQPATGLRPGGGKVDGDLAQLNGYVSNNGYSFVQDNWIRRGLTSTGGTVNWTDKLTMKSYTTPSFTSSRHSLTMTYFPTTGFFSSPSVDIDAYTGISSYVGSTGKVSIPLTGTSAKVAYYSSVKGGTVFHSLVLFAVQRTGGEAYDGQQTYKAKCPSDATTCSYL